MSQHEIPDVDQLKDGDVFWIKCEVDSIDSDGEIHFSYLDQVDNEDAGTEESHSNGSIWVPALREMYGQDGTAPKPGDLVYSQASPGATGKLVTVIKGVGVVDWAWENPQAPAALSNLAMSALRRFGE